MKSHQSGIRLIDAILQEQTWEIIEDNGIKDGDFHGDSSQILRELRKYVNTHNEFPPKDVLESRIKSNCAGLHEFAFPKTMPKEAALDFFFDDKVDNDLNNFMRDMKDIRKRDGDQAVIDFIETAARSIRSVRNKSSTVSYKETAQNRLERHNDLKWAMSSKIETPWATANKLLEGGWDIDASPHIIAGVSGCGKSWSAVVTALHAAFVQSKRVLFVSMENGLGSIENRMDAYYARVPYAQMKKGTLEIRSYNQYFKVLENLKNMEGEIFIDDSRGLSVNDIAKLSEKHAVDLVIVDGAYLINPTQRSENGTQALANLAKELQEACKMQKETAWIQILQLKPEAAKIEDGKEMAMNTRGSKEFYISSASNFSLTADKSDRLMSRIKVKFGKDREYSGESNVKDYFYIQDDKLNMSFEEIDISEYEDEELAELV